LGEQHSAVVTHPQDAAGHADGDVAGLDGHRNGVARRLSDGVCVDTVVLQRLQLRHPDSDLLGQPGTAGDVAVAAGDAVEVRGTAVVVQETGLGQ
jgi:hypothetical protein